MNPKGPSLVDLDTVESASTRRSLIGAAGAAGVVGAAAALLGASRAVATPNKPTEADLAGLVAAIQLELAARDLYRLAATRLDGDEAELATVVADNHEAYSESISGATGVSITDLEPTDLGDLRGAFDTADGQAFAAAARTLENTAVATHTALLAGYESLDAIELTASIITVEARHAAVLTSLAGFAANLDDLLDPVAEPLGASGGAA